MDSKKTYDVMTGAEFNTHMANTKMYKLLNSDLIHNGYKYEPNALNDLTKLGEQFDPDPDCKPNGLYFCAESEIIRFLGCVGPIKKVVLVEIPLDAQVSVGPDKFKTDKLIIGEPTTFDEFFSDEYITNMPDDYLMRCFWGYRPIWEIAKRRYLLAPDKTESKYKLQLLYIAVQQQDVTFLDLIRSDIQKMLTDPQIDKDLINLLKDAPWQSDSVIEWFSTHFPQHTSLINSLKRKDKRHSKFSFGGNSK